jgi:hypothetical protein
MKIAGVASTLVIGAIVSTASIATMAEVAGNVIPSQAVGAALSARRPSKAQHRISELKSVRSFRQKTSWTILCS